MKTKKQRKLARQLRKHLKDLLSCTTARRQVLRECASAARPLMAVSSQTIHPPFLSDDERRLRGLSDTNLQRQNGPTISEGSPVLPHTPPPAASENSALMSFPSEAARRIFQRLLVGSPQAEGTSHAPTPGAPAPGKTPHPLAHLKGYVILDILSLCAPRPLDPSPPRVSPSAPCTSPLADHPSQASWADLHAAPLPTPGPSPTPGSAILDRQVHPCPQAATAPLSAQADS